MENFEELSKQYQYFLLDAYGVFWGSAKVGLLPGAKELMEYLISQGKQVGILSNSTQLASKEKTKLAKHGLEEEVHYHFLLTSGEVTRNLLLSNQLPFPAPRKKYYLFGGNHPRFASSSALFEEAGYFSTEHLDEADFIYLGVPHINGLDQEDPNSFRGDVQSIAKKDLPVLCANPDRYAHEGNPPRLVVRQGTIADLFQSQGASVFFIGKPYSPAFKQAIKHFPDEIQPSEILMVGDTPETDVRGARQLGLASALVTQTGVMKERIGKGEMSDALNQLSETDRPDHLTHSFALNAF